MYELAVEKHGTLYMPAVSEMTITISGFMSLRTFAVPLWEIL